MTPEGKVKRDVKKYLDEIGAYHVWPVPTGYGPKLLDCYACIQCLFVTIETKKLGGKATVAQALEMDKIRAKGGIALLVDSLQSLRDQLFKLGLVP